MRTVFAYYFIWILMNAFNVQSEENKITCEMAAFLEDSDGTKPFLIDSGSIPNAIQLTSCEDSTDVCEKLAEEQAIAGTDRGNFTLVADERNGYTIGDILCDKADAIEENVRNKVVRIYWRLCESPWKPTSFKMPELLCCEDGLYFPCRTLKSEL